MPITRRLLVQKGSLVHLQYNFCIVKCNKTEESREVIYINSHYIDSVYSAIAMGVPKSLSTQVANLPESHTLIRHVHIVKRGLAT